MRMRLNFSCSERRGALTVRLRVTRIARCISAVPRPGAGRPFNEWPFRPFGTLQPAAVPADRQTMGSSMNHLTKTAIAAFGLVVAAGTATADSRVYGPFPVTVKGYDGSAENSVKYTGQVARHALHESLKKIASRGDGSENADLKALMDAYFSGKEDGREIVAPTSKEGFPVIQSTVDELSGGKNLAGKTYGGAISGWPNNMTGAEVIQFWIDKAASAEGGYDMRHGYEYPQLISKFIMGATFYNQAVDNYLDEKLAADVKPNDKPYGEGAPYTGKEHSWDEAFGYFGAPAHTLSLTAQQVYDIAKQKPEALAYADHNEDGKVDLLTEMTFGPAYYAAGFDAGTYGSEQETNYLHTIVGHFYEGRKLLAEAGGEKLSDDQRQALRDHASAIESAWQTVLAEAVFKYAGSTYEHLEKLEIILDSNGDTAETAKRYVHYWSELKGFAMALQAGRENLGETGLRLDRLIGFGPVMPNQSQVLGINSDGSYRKGQGTAFGEYMLHMLKVQQLMVDKFGVKARNNDQLADMADLADSVSTGGSVEND